MDAILFPAAVAYEHVRLDDAGDLPSFSDVEVPLELAHALPARKAAFRAGRYCAQRALRRALPELTAAPIAIGADRAPLWPAGAVGAITHTTGFAAAAVARAADAWGVGLDAEPILSGDAVDMVLKHAVRPPELAPLRGRTSLSEPALLTVCFSAKETLFKCLYPSVGRYFDFSDVVIVDVSEADASFLAEVNLVTGALPRGGRIAGRFVIDGELVQTGIALLRDDRAR